MVQYWNQFPFPNDTSLGDQLNTMGYRFKRRSSVTSNVHCAADFQINSTNTLFGGNSPKQTNTLPQFPAGCRSTRTYTVAGCARLSTLLSNSLTTSSATASPAGIGDHRRDERAVHRLPRVSTRSIPIRTAPPGTPVHNFTNDRPWVKGNHTFALRDEPPLRSDQHHSYYKLVPLFRTNTFWRRAQGCSSSPGT